jgi:DNA polymerase elongation subunit (family B)
VARWQENHITKYKKGKKKGVPYTGGKVLDPIPGIQQDVVTYDVGSMYPVISIVINLSRLKIVAKINSVTEVKYS